MSLQASSQAAAVRGLVRSDPHEPGISRVRTSQGFLYRDPSGAEITQGENLDRIRALRIPPAWENVWISPDPLGHVQAIGVDSQGRTQYIYHRLWREQRDTQKFAHMLRFASALPGLRRAVVADLKRGDLARDRVAAGAVRLIDLSLFRLGSEKYAELDHHYGATTLKKQHVRLTPDGMVFDYIAKAGKRRTIMVKDPLVLPMVETLADTDNGLESLFCYENRDGWHSLHSHDVANYIATRSGGHFTAKEFRTWNATVLMALALANAGYSPVPRARKKAIAAGIREVARWLGDTPSVARGSYIDPRLIALYESEGQLATIPQLPPRPPAPRRAEIAVSGLLAACEDTDSLP
jgi:DNA topoisomerase-1